MSSAPTKKIIVVTVKENVQTNKEIIIDGETKEIAATTPARAEFVASLFPSDKDREDMDVSEIYIANLSDIHKKIIDYDKFWDVLLDTEERSYVPLIVPTREKYNLYAIYINSQAPLEYRLVLDSNQEKYYKGETAETYNTLRYVNSGIVDVYPKLIILDPLSIDDGEQGNFELWKTLIDQSKAVFLDVVDCKQQDSTEICVFAVYSKDQPDRFPFEYRIVVDPERIKFYSDNSITDERNDEILDDEEDARVNSDGTKVIQIRR
jgi:hypothetical protein